MDRCCNKTSNYNSKQIFCFRISSSLKVISISHREKRYRRIGRINICRDKDNLQLQKNYVRPKSSFHSLLICVCSAARGLCFSDSSSKNVNKKCGAPAVIGLSRNDFIIISSPPSNSHQNFIFILLRTKVFYSTKKNSVKFHKETIMKYLPLHFIVSDYSCLTREGVKNVDEKKYDNSILWSSTLFYSSILSIL